MGFLDKIMGGGQPAQAAEPAFSGAIPPARVGLNGEYDESGLAKRVAKAFDEDAALTDIDTLWVAQTGAEVVLKGSVPSQDILNKMVSIASQVSGANSVQTDQVSVG
jgi:osmotically-inducible protein OsmY